MKKLYACIMIFILTMAIGIPVSASDYNNSNYLFFTGSRYDGVEAPIGIPQGATSDKYILSYSGWKTGSGANCAVKYCALPVDCQYLTYIPLGSSDYFRLSWSGGQGVCRSISYDLNNNYYIASDTTSNIGSFDSPGQYGALYTNVPIRSQSGDPMFTPATPSTFEMHSVVDSYGVIHFSTTTNDTFPANSFFNATYYLINGSYDTPNFVSGYITSVQQVGNYNIANYNPFDGLMHKVTQALTLGYQSRDLYTYSIENVTSTQKQTFDITNYPQNVFYATGTISNSSGSFNSLETSVDCFQLQSMKGSGGIYANDHLAMICVISDSNGNYYICRQDFNSKDIKNKVISDFSQNLRDIIGSQTDIELPEHQDAIGKQVTDLQDLAEYLQYVYNTTNNNTANYIYNGVQSLDGLDWGSIFSPITGGIAGLSNEFDTVLNGVFDHYTVPSEEQLDEIQDEISDAEDELHDKFQFVTDIRAEVTFIIDAVVSSSSDDFTFDIDLSDYHDVGSVTIFDSSTIDSDILDTAKDVITCFLSIAVVFYIFKTLPSTIGNMPKGD